LGVIQDRLDAAVQAIQDIVTLVEAVRTAIADLSDEI
jgi:hypothetical protein